MFGLQQCSRHPSKVVIEQAALSAGHLGYLGYLVAGTSQGLLTGCCFQPEVSLFVSPTDTHCVCVEDDDSASLTFTNLLSGDGEEQNRERDENGWMRWRVVLGGLPSVFMFFTSYVTCVLRSHDQFANLLAGLFSL